MLSNQTTNTFGSNLPSKSNTCTLTLLAISPRLSANRTRWPLIQVCGFLIGSRNSSLMSKAWLLGIVGAWL
ncbi:hypothetical protein B296_00035517 [Ensete ventricosum]|uniref:Uncharacterized protein n=1 Tax=Ensete ventricosum TaxID=4639 RepID=A0A426Z5H7_ENSVE|nr:hypothetical protein B296_00035517 [Ensete ventricosum]